MYVYCNIRKLESRSNKVKFKKILALFYNKKLSYFTTRKQGKKF